MSEDYLDATIYGDGPRRITPDESERDVSIALSRPLVLLALRRKIGVPPVVLRAAGGINGWMPDINANGEIVSGAGEIFFGAQSLGIGTTPRWIDNDRFVYNSAVAPEKTGIRNARNGKLEAAIDPAYNQYSSGGGKWSGLWQGRPQVIARLYDAKTQKVLREAKNVCNFELAPNGSYAFYTGFDSKANTVFVNSGKSGAKDVKVFEGEVTVVAKTDGAVVICAATGTYSRRIVVVRDDAVIESSIHTWEDPIGVDVDDSTWVLSVTVDGIMLRKAGSTQGHYWPGEWFNPAIALSPERTIIIAASTGQGQPQHVEVDPKATGIDLRTVPDPMKPKPKPVCGRKFKKGESGNCPDCGNPKSKHAEELEPPVPEDKIPPNRFEIVQRIDREHPHLIATNTKATVTEFMWLLGNALHEADEKYGLLTKSAGENHIVIKGERYAVDAVAYEGIDPIVDVLKSAGDGPGKGGITWGIDKNRRKSNKWAKPPALDGAPPVEPKKHAYDGGDNDTGECDVILENGKKCNRPPDDPIHVGVVDPGEPVPDPSLLRRLQVVEEKAQASQQSVKAIEGRVEELAKKISDSGMSEQSVRALVSELLSTIKIDVDVKSAGPTIEFFGRKFNLSHDHEVEASVSIAGTRVAHTLKPARTIAQDITLDGDDAANDNPEP